MTDAAGSPGFRAEAERIHWRAWVMSQPGGVAWLLEQCRRLKYREPRIGPRTLVFPGATT